MRGLSSLRVAGSFLMILLVLLLTVTLKLDGIYAGIILMFMMLIVFSK